jgi:membrane protease YdiL (CAAX protease family)
MESHHLRYRKSADSSCTNIAQAVWFAAVLVPMLGSQIVRLHQHHAGSWIVFGIMPAGLPPSPSWLRSLPRAPSLSDGTSVKFPFLKLLFGVGVSFVERLSQWPRRFINEAFPSTVLGVYPRPSDWLYLIDLVFGLALVAASEEIIFRQCARHVLQPYVSNSIVAVLATSLVFGAYHWWAGIGNVLLASVIGVLLMLMLRRSAALWPVALAHYLVDLIAFA